MIKAAVLGSATTIVVLVFGFMLAFPYIGDAIESVCIPGRLSNVQAELVNSVEWEHTPTYCEGEEGVSKNPRKPYIGQSDCRVKKNDRILKAECSQAMRFLSKGD